MRIKIKGSSRNPKSWEIIDLATGERLTGIKSIDCGVDSLGEPYCFLQFEEFELDINEVPTLVMKGPHS